MAVDSEGEYKALWERACAGLASWGEILPLAKARCTAARAAGDLRIEADELWELKFLLYKLGRPEEAISVQRRELKLYRRIGNAREVALTLGSLGDKLRAAGKLNSALRCWRQATAWYFRTGDPVPTFHGLTRIADLLKQAGRREEARTTFHLALSIAPNDHDGWTPTRILGELDDLE